MILQFTITNQKISYEKVEAVNKSRNYLIATFSFMTSDWDDLNKYVTFKTRDKNHIILIQDEEMIVPNDCLLQKSFKVSVHGTSDDNETIITTNEKVVIIDMAGFTHELTDNNEDETDISSIDLVNYLQLKSKQFYDYAVIENNTIRLYNNGQVINNLPISITYDQIADKPTVYPPSSHTHTQYEVTDLQEALDTDLDLLLTNLTEKIRQI